MPKIAISMHIYSFKYIYKIINTNGYDPIYIDIQKNVHTYSYRLKQMQRLRREPCLK
jgi:hypothetical protein